MKSYKPSALKWDFTVYWSFVSTVFAVRTVPTNLLFPTVPTDPLYIRSYCSYRSSVPTDPTVPTDPLFLLILCSY